MQNDPDFSVLEALANHDETRFRKYALLFIQSMEDVLGQLDVAMAAGDTVLLGSMGHRAKSTALNIGALQFSGQCLLLEQIAAGHDTAGAIAIARTLRPMFGDIRLALLQRLAK